MLVKDIIKNSATLIGRDDVVKRVEGKDYTMAEFTTNTVDTMVRLLNLVVSELAGSFVPLITTEWLNVTDGKVLYSDLSYRVKEVLKAFDVNGVDRLIAVENTFLRAQGDMVEVEYSYFPNEFTLNDQIGYQEKDVPLRVLCYGLLAEYSISQGCFKDAVMWHDRYADELMQICKPKNANIKRRNWL